MMFSLETFRLIKRSFKRFMSLTLIVFIGSGFMMGLLTTYQTMRVNDDIYNDEYDFTDLMIYSPYGFCVEDYEKLSSADGVQTVFASKEIDCKGTNSAGRVNTYRVTEMSRKNDRFKLVSGRLPENGNECLYLRNSLAQNYQIGERIELDYGSADISEYLTQKEYTIVGIVESPHYLSKILGPSNFNNEELECVIFIPNTNFLTEYYTTMYLTLEGTEELVSYTGVYEDFIEDRKAELKTVVKRQQSYYRDQLVAEAAATLDESERLFQEMKAAAGKQLDDAKDQLDEARIQIASYEAQLVTAGALVRSLQQSLNRDSDLFESVYNSTVSVEQNVSYILSALGLNEINYASSAMEYMYNEYRNALSQYYSLSGQISSAQAQYEQGLKEYADALVAYEQRMADGEEQLKAARAKLEDLPKSEWIILDRGQIYPAAMFSATCDQMKSIGLYMPFMFFLVAGLVCLTTMKRLVDEQRGQIGIYTALGYSDGAIIGKYVTYALLASLCGGIPGVIFGGCLYPAVIYNTWKMMYYLPEVKIIFPVWNVVLSIGLFTLLMCGITAYVVREDVKDVPASLMRPLAPKKGKEIVLEKIKWLWNSMSFTSKITSRNIFRYKSRFLMTIAGIAGCTGLLILGFGISDSVNDVLGIQYTEIFRYDYQINLKSSENILDGLGQFKSDPAVEYATDCLSYTTRAYLDGEEKTANMLVIEPVDSYTVFELRETDKTTPLRLTNSGIIVSELFARNNGLKVGDIITIESQSRIKEDVRISGICEMYFQHYIFMSKDLYEDIFDESSDGNKIMLLSDDGNRVREISEKLEDYVSVTDPQYFLDAFDNMIKALNLIIIVIILVAGSLAFVVLVNLTQVNISERIREIATLKVLGFIDHEVNMYIFKEIILLSLIGCVVGIPIGIIEHRFIMKVIGMEMIMFGLKINTVSFIYAIAITMIFTFIVLLFMRRPLRRVDMVESLKSVE